MKKDKRSLYESIMNKISVEVKNALNEVNGCPLEDEDITLVNTDEDGRDLYMVRIWPGIGYFLTAYNAYAFSEEDALEKVVVWLEINDRSMLKDEEAEELITELEKEHADEEEYDYMQDPYFYESYMYVDATMAGAEEYHYICAANLAIYKCKADDTKSPRTRQVSESVWFKKNRRPIFEDTENTSDGYVVLRNNRCDTSDDPKYAIVKESDIEYDYPMNQTYIEYGNICGHYAAGDWTIGNDDFEEELLSAISHEFFNDAEIETRDFVIDEEDYSIEYTGYDEEIEEIVNDLHDDLQKFVEEYVKDNEAIYTCTCLNYWDGHNRRSIILDMENGDDNMLEWMFANDEETEEILTAYDKAEFGEWIQGRRSAHVDDEYTFYQSCWQGAWSVADVVLN